MIACGRCGTSFKSSRYGRFCSGSCYMRAYRERIAQGGQAPKAEQPGYIPPSKYGICSRCEGVMYLGKGSLRTGGTCLTCRRSRSDDAANKRLRRRGVAGIARGDLLAYLLKRDRNRCGICCQPIRAKKGPRRPSVDHIVPLSLGGKHELENLQAAHYDCNLRKAASGSGGQLLLVG